MIQNLLDLLEYTRSGQQISAYKPHFPGYDNDNDDHGYYGGGYGGDGDRSDTDNLWNDQVVFSDFYKLYKINRIY